MKREKLKGYFIIHELRLDLAHNQGARKYLRYAIGYDPVHDRLVLIERLQPGVRDRARIANYRGEVRARAALKDARLLQPIACSGRLGEPYCVFEWTPRQSLVNLFKHWQARKLSCAMETAAAIIVEAARALAKMRARTGLSLRFEPFTPQDLFLTLDGHIVLAECGAWWTEHKHDTLTLRTRSAQRRSGQPNSSTDDVFALNESCKLLMLGDTRDDPTKRSIEFLSDLMRGTPLAKELVRAESPHEHDRQQTLEEYWCGLLDALAAEKNRPQPFELLFAGKQGAIAVDHARWLDAGREAAKQERASRARWLAPAGLGAAAAVALPFGLAAKLSRRPSPPPLGAASSALGAPSSACATAPSTLGRPAHPPSAQRPPSSAPSALHLPASAPSAQRPPSSAPSALHLPASAPSAQRSPSTAPSAQRPPALAPSALRPPAALPPPTSCAVAAPAHAPRPQPRARRSACSAAFDNVHLELTVTGYADAAWLAAQNELRCLNQPGWARMMRDWSHAELARGDGDAAKRILDRYLTVRPGDDDARHERELLP